MKYKKVEISSTNGRAVVTRKGNTVVIQVTPSKSGAGRGGRITVDARPIGLKLGYDECDDHQYLAACKLQEALDGFKGGRNDIARYESVIRHFCD